MANHNLKIAIEKSLSILPTRLEIAKLRNVLTPVELDELDKTISDNPISKEINKEHIKKFEMDVKNNINPYDSFNARGAETLYDIFGFECTDLVKECTDELRADPQYSHLNPIDHEDEIIKILTQKMIIKISAKPDMLSKLLDKVSCISNIGSNNKRHDFDPFRKEELK